jgi:hypothetical protein
MNWIRNKVEKIFRRKHITNSNLGKSFIELSEYLGTFQYHEDGFTLTYEEFEKRVNWRDITQINVFKVDQMTVDRIDMEIVIGNTSFTISEEFPGWYQFVAKTKEVFPIIPNDWDVEIVKPAFAENYRTIYQTG